MTILNDKTKIKTNETMKLFLLIGLSIYKIKGLAQGVLIFLTASATVPFIDVIKKYVIPNSFDNWVIFTMLLILDTGSGIFKHSGWWEKGQPNTLNRDEFFFKLFRKVFAGSVWLIMINMVMNIEDANMYFDTFGISTVISWLGWSIASNLYIVSGSTFPPKWVMDKFKQKNDEK
jgi:hypothetical protein